MNETRSRGCESGITYLPGQGHDLEMSSLEERMNCSRRCTCSQVNQGDLFNRE